jgi:hypothetical protein
VKCALQLALARTAGAVAYLTVVIVYLKTGYFGQIDGFVKIGGPR